jgi:hypothetical protein
MASLSPYLMRVELLNIGAFIIEYDSPLNTTWKRLRWIIAVQAQTTSFASVSALGGFDSFETNECAVTYHTSLI